jgi:hypothetical protein
MELSQEFANIAAARGSKSGSIPVLPGIDTAINLVIDINVLPISASNITIFEPDTNSCLPESAATIFQLAGQGSFSGGNPV